MARIIDSNHFADGWQNKKASEKVSENIRESGQKHVEANKTVASKMLEGVAQSKNMDASHTTAAATQRTNTVNTPVERQVSQQSSTQAARPEVQTEGAVQQAREQFQKVRSEARSLENLVSSRSEPRAPQTATSSAVPSTPSTTQANVQQNAQGAGTFSLSQTMNRAAEPQAQAQAASRNVDPRRLSPEDQARVRQGAENAELQDVSRQGATPEAVNPAGVAPQAGLTTRNGEGTSREEGRDSRTSQKRTGTQSARASGSQRASGSTSEETSRLMGGESFFSGGGDDEAGADAAPAAEPVTQTTLPETDETLHIYNEIDTTRPGIETILAKRNILERNVIKSVVDKRVAEIAALDQSVGNFIQDRFAPTPLSGRIVGELQDEIRTADFLKGLYGGGLSA